MEIYNDEAKFMKDWAIEDDYFITTKKFNRKEHSEEVSVFTYTKELNDVLLQWSGIEPKNMIQFSSSQHISE